MAAEDRRHPAAQPAKQSRGKNQRLHRTLNAEKLGLRLFRDFVHAQQAFDEWRGVYNQQRLHAALDYLAPTAFEIAYLI